MILVTNTMEGLRNEPTKGVLNETTRTVHRHETGKSDLQTACGLTYNVDPDRLRRTSIEQATTDFNASKCGRCFDDAGGY